MKTLSNLTEREDIMRRLRAVGRASPHRWGRMSSHQMVCHLSDGFRLYMSLKPARPLPTPYPSMLLKWAALWAPIPWPKDFRTAPELDQEAEGTKPTAFDNDLSELQDLINRFTRQPRDFQWQAHPHFGRMSDREWMRLAYLHVDHHLRQFGA